MLISINPNSNNPITLIVKYRNSFSDIPTDMYISAEDLGYGFALVTLDKNAVENLISQPQIIYAEADKMLSFQQFENPNPQNSFYCGFETELNGDGVVVGIIDSPIDVSHPIFNGVNITYYGEQPTLPNPHGTNVAAIIPQIAPRAEIIGIGIREQGDTFAKASDIMQAVARLIQLAGDRPLVINISYGTNDGSHAGDSLFEEYLDTVAQNQLISIVVAAGNMGNSAKHFFAVSDGGLISAEIGVVSQDFGLAIWKNFADDFLLMLTAPNNETFTLTTGNYYFYGNISVYRSVPTPYSLNSEIYINFQRAEQGLWRVMLYPQQLATQGVVNMWLNNSGLTNFSNPTADITATLPSFAQRVITVGAYNSAENAAATFSGRGFAANGLIKPDLVAPGVDVYTATLNGGYTTVSGTSFAAPFVSAVAALLMQWGIVNGNDGFLYGQRLKAFLRKGANRIRNLSYPNTEWGYGSLCFESTLRLLETEGKQ